MDYNYRKLRWITSLRIFRLDFYQHQYYHLYNRSINQEELFSSDRNYVFFLNKYKNLSNYFDTLVYCLMPTHFHFLVNAKIEDQNPIRRAIGDLLGGYSRAVNKERNRSGSLFQQHSKAKLIKTEKHLIALMHYIHQNPLHANLVVKMEDWKYSSYREYIKKGKGLIPLDLRLLNKYRNIQEFIEHSNMIIE